MPHPSNHKIIGIGAVMVDEIFFSKEPVMTGTSNPATMNRSAGGVMRNIMYHLALLETNPLFLTVTGDDADGKWIQQNCIEAGIQLVCNEISGAGTGRYVSILNPDGSMHAAAVANACENNLNIDFLLQHEGLLSASTILLADTNLEPGVLQWLVDFSNSHNIKMFIEPVSVAKAAKLLHVNLEGVYMVTPNEEELYMLAPGGRDTTTAIKKLLEKGIRNVWLRSGANGSVLYSNNRELKLSAPVVTVVDSTGAGDAALAGWLAAYTFGFDEQTCLRAGHSLAARVLETKGAVAPVNGFHDLLTSIKKYYPLE